MTSKPRRKRAVIEHIDTGNMRAFAADIRRYVEGACSIDRLRAYVAALDPYVAAYGWGTYVLPAVRDDDGNVLVEETLNKYRSAAALHAVRAARRDAA